MPKEPLYPHVPGKREPLFPHVPTDWVYAKVGTTEVRGRREPSGIQIEQVSPTYNLSDFDKAVKIIEEKLQGQHLLPVTPVVPSIEGIPRRLSLEQVSGLETRFPIEKLWRDERAYLDKLTTEIEREGLTEPVTIRVRDDGSLIVWDGMHRLAVAQKLGIKDIPVEFIGNISAFPKGLLAPEVAIPKTKPSPPISSYEWEGWLEDCPFSFLGLAGRTIRDKKTGKEYHQVLTGIELGAPYVLLAEKKFYGVAKPAFELKRYWITPKRSATPAVIPTKPSGKCYEDAWRFLIKEEEGELIHGSVQTIGKRINHAWVETETGYIWEPESGEFMKKDYFYERAQPKVEARYTPEEAAIMAARTKNHGPWTDAERKAFLKPRYLKEPTTTHKEETHQERMARQKKQLERGEEILKRAREITKKTTAPQTFQGGEPVPPEYRYLVDFLSGALPEYSLAVLPAVEAEVGERKIDAVMKQLKAGVEGIQDSSQFRLFLTTMSKFHDYSIGNQILIMLQQPNATHVAGFVTWKELGRWVKRGGKSISILAPIFPPRATCPKCGTKISKGAQFCPKCGEQVKVEEEVEVHYFKVVSVFDISQTEGKPLPEFEVPVLTGVVNEELFSKLLALMKKQDVSFSSESKPDLPSDIKGQYIDNRIWVRPEEPRAQQLKTLLHEIAHYYTSSVFRIPRQDAETIAESAAYVIGAHHGFDTGVRSFPYVALWAKDKKVLEKNLGDIRKTATTILEDLEKS